MNNAQTPDSRLNLEEQPPSVDLIHLEGSVGVHRLARPVNKSVSRAATWRAPWASR